jgi:ABC-type multidrug transport system fused ATPase/permease subunit
VERAGTDTFAKACAYLSYRPLSKWTAYIAGILSGLVYIGLLAVLGLFADLMVERGKLPNFHDLPIAQQNTFLEDWNGLDDEARTQRLTAVGYDKPDVDRLKARTASRELQRGEVDALWRGYLHAILNDRVGQAAAARIATPPVPDDSGNIRLDYDGYNNGILSLVARAHLSGSRLAPVAAWLARIAPWTWSVRGDGTGLFSAFLTGLFLSALVLAALGALLALLVREAAGRAVVEATTRLRKAVYHHTFRLGTLAFRALGPTEAVSVFTRHVEAVHEALYTRLTVVFREPIKFGLILLFAVVVNFWLAFAFLVFAFLVWIVGGQIATYYRTQARTATNQAGENLTVLRESLMMMRLVKCYYRMEEFNRARVERQLSHYGRLQLKRMRGEAVYQPILAFFGLLAVLLLLYAAGLTMLSGYVPVASVIVLATAMVSLYKPVQTWLDSRKFTQRGKESAALIFKFLDRPSEVRQDGRAEFLNPLGKQLEFDSVSLREPGSTRLLLEEVSLSIKSGQRVGLVGSDDLEKYALIYLIPRLLDPTTGEIRIDDHNLRWVTLDSLRNQIATVLQHNLIFHDTIANNIGCGDPAYTLPQIMDAAKLARAHQFIQKLPQGYETNIGELGHSLSVSQQFRIALARAVLRDPALLIVEEPNDSIDDETKDLLDDTMARVLPGRTTIFIPHRISTLRSCDQLFLLHHGKIIAGGTHKELLASSTLYRHLHYLEFNEVGEQ